VSGLALTALLALLLAPPPLARAASFTLETQQRSDALRVGAQSATREGPFDAEWRVANPAGDSLTVITPFHRLVLAARNAAFKNERMKDNEPEKLLREQQDRLVIWASLRGQREDFARFFVPRILVSDREIEPSFGPKARLILVVRDTDGRDVSRFTIDLASMR
jgi:hypothetical protein